MAATFDVESEAQVLAAELNDAADRDVRYPAERYRGKWAIARRIKRTYWGWDGYPDKLFAAPPPRRRRRDCAPNRQFGTRGRHGIGRPYDAPREREHERHQ